MIMPDVQNAKFQKDELVLVNLSRANFYYKAKVVDVWWDSFFSRWAYQVKLTGNRPYEYRNINHITVSGIALTKRS